MKQFFTLLLSLVTVAVFAQSITLSQDTVRLKHGDKIDIGSFLITNTSSGSIDIDCTLRPECYNPLDSSSQVAICFGVLCFAPVSTETTFGELTLEPVAVIPSGASDNSFKLEIISDKTYGSTWAVDFFNQADPSDKATLIIFVENCRNTSSTDDNFQSKNFSIAPNPATDVLNLDFAPINSQRILNIYNTIGQLQNTEIIAPNVVTHTKDISNLKVGTYFVQMTANDGSSLVKKLIVR